MPKFAILIETDHVDGDEIVRSATEKIACDLDWGGHNTTGISGIRLEADEPMLHMHGHTYLAGFDMEPSEEECCCDTNPGECPLHEPGLIDS